LRGQLDSLLLSGLQIRSGTWMCRRDETHVLVATKVARLCRIRLFANRGRMPGFAN
jgi:ribosomal protein S14